MESTIIERNLNLKLEDPKLEEKRKLYFSLVAENRKSKITLQLCQDQIKNQKSKIWIHLLLRFCLQLHHEDFPGIKDFINGNSNPATFKKILQMEGQRHLSSLMTEHDELKNDFLEIQKQIKVLEHQRIQSYSLIEVMEKQLRGVRALERIPLQGYGINMKKLCQLIHKSTAFIREPKGPLGNLFTVRVRLINILLS